MSWSWRGSRTPRRSSSPAAMSLTASYTICGQWHPWILRPLITFVTFHRELSRPGIIISSTARRRRRRRRITSRSVEAKYWRANYFEWNGKHLNRDKNFVPTSFVKYRAFERHKFSIESITVGSNERIFMVSWGGPRKVITTAIP